MTDIFVSGVRYGLPKLNTKSNGAFTKGREMAQDVLKAGAGHYAYAAFDVNDDARIATFISGARYVSKSNPNVRVKRRKVDDHTINIYVLNEGADQRHLDL